VCLFKDLDLEGYINFGIIASSHPYRSPVLPKSIQTHSSNSAPKHNPYSPTFTMSSKKAISRRKLLKLLDKPEAFDLKM